MSMTRRIYNVVCGVVVALLVAGWLWALLPLLAPEPGPTIVIPSPHPAPSGWTNQPR